MKKLSVIISILLIILILPLIFCKEKAVTSELIPEKTVKPEETGSKDNAEAAKEFVNLLAEGKYEDAVKDFDIAMEKALPPAKLKEAWEAVIKEAGGFKEQAGTRSEKMDSVAGIFFPTAQISSYEPPSYADPGKFTEKEITVGSKDWPLPGTLTLPAGDGPFPLVVLVHGSGPQDRDETLGPSKPFKDLAWGLASRGIAVLRYEKRTKEHRLKMVAEKKAITVKEETVDDALASVAILRDMDKIDKNRIFVLGHSLGGMLIPRIGKGDSEIAGFIIMGGATARPLEDIFLDQMEYIFSLDGEISETEEKELKKIREGVAKIKDPALSPDTPEEELLMGVPAAYWLDLRDYKPAEVMKTLPHPVLIIQGERDYQVTMEDFGIWKESLADRKNTEFKSYPELNHLFIQGEGKSVPKEYKMPGHVAEYVIEDIAGWVKKSGK
ncbi:MAG TPA: DUF3887 domain-containing protein [Candidatus Eremiobacteraeota bacterium]|nr:DUF3887 domain-containing protein [Candidatus Eremiobacteraeota bacterium]